MSKRVKDYMTLDELWISSPWYKYSAFNSLNELCKDNDGIYEYFDRVHNSNIETLSSSIHNFPLSKNREWMPEWTEDILKEINKIETDKFNTKIKGYLDE